MPQGQDHALVRRGRTCGHQRGADGGVIQWEGALDGMQGGQKPAERSARKGFTHTFTLVASKCLDALFGTDTFGFIAKDDGVTIKRDAQLR
ncbi:MAG: hypothetical protein BWZ07_02804 [Alphaproteobacteria bacterium ADurb.BinA280]|nr:MAG: hypothetical protein BWZ07_02804 [Alphaproteobacteria bacterium ADurb.BinA280]